MAGRAVDGYYDDVMEAGRADTHSSVDDYWLEGQQSNGGGVL